MCDDLTIIEYSRVVCMYVCMVCCCSPIAVIHMPRQPVRREVTEEAQVTPLPHRQLVLAVDDSQDSMEAAQWTLENLYNAGEAYIPISC